MPLLQRNFLHTALMVPRCVSLVDEVFALSNAASHWPVQTAHQVIRNALRVRPALPHLQLRLPSQFWTFDFLTPSSIVTASFATPVR